jgi:hypothetical protein
MLLVCGAGALVGEQGPVRGWCNSQGGMYCLGSVIVRKLEGNYGLHGYRAEARSAS